MKLCKKCNMSKQLKDFPITGKGYISHKCKSCVGLYKKNRKNNLTPFTIKECKECGKNFETRLGIRCKSCNSKKYGKQKIKNNIKCLYCGIVFSGKTRSQYCSKQCSLKKWRQDNPDKNRKINREHNYKYYHDNINYKIADILRTRLYKALKNNQRVGSAVRDLGCTIKELKKHLESQFQPGMNWRNHTLDGWHIDHIKPLSGFDLSDSEEFKEACHYSNLQPLWAKDNLSKGNRYNDGM